MCAEAFIRKALGTQYAKDRFVDLPFSTSTLVVRFADDTEIDSELFALYAWCQSAEEGAKPGKKPPGTITGINNGEQSRGYNQTGSKRVFKNSHTFWIWLTDKQVSAKLSVNSLHLTGCKTVNQAAEAGRYVQQHLRLLYEAKGIPVYEEYPHIVEIQNCMISFNFDLRVALNLTKFATYIIGTHHKEMWTPYDPNLHSYMMPLSHKCGTVSYSIHHNGRISMRTNIIDPEAALEAIQKRYDEFHVILKQYHKYLQRV